MPPHTRQARAESLREFLLSQAGRLDDDILKEARDLVDVPVEYLNIKQLMLDQLLDDWQAGHISRDKFVKTWTKIIDEIQQGQRNPSRRRPRDKLTGKPRRFRWGLVLVLMLGVLALAGLGWFAYKAGWFKPGNPPQAAQAPTPKPVAQAPATPQLAPPPQPVPPPQPAAEEPPPPAAPESPAANHVTEGLMLAEQAKVAVAAYYIANGQYPGNNAQVGLPQPASLHGNAVSSVAVGAGGAITITYNKLAGKGQTLVLQPGGTQGGAVVWDCKKGTIPAKYRPAQCR